MTTERFAKDAALVERPPFNVLPCDFREAEKFRRGHGGKYDRDIAMLTAAFARHRLASAAALRAENARLRAGIADMVASIRRNTPPHAKDIADGLVGASHEPG